MLALLITLVLTATALLGGLAGFVLACFAMEVVWPRPYPMEASTLPRSAPEPPPLASTLHAGSRILRRPSSAMRHALASADTVELPVGGE